MSSQVGIEWKIFKEPVFFCLKRTYCCCFLKVILIYEIMNGRFFFEKGLNYEW